MFRTLIGEISFASFKVLVHVRFILKFTSEALAVIKARGKNKTKEVFLSLSLSLSLGLSLNFSVTIRIVFTHHVFVLSYIN